MSAVIAVLPALVLLLAPIFAALPDAPSVIASSEWTSFLCCGTFLALFLTVLAARRGGLFDLRPSAAEKAFLVLLGLSFLSIPMRLAMQHGTGYFGVMLRGWSLLAADFALFALARRVASSRVCLYALIAAAVAGSAIVADIGVQEYVVHLRAGEIWWRIFATSTPDFLAGYFVLMLPVTLALFLEAPALRGLTPLLRSASTLVLGVILFLQFVALLTTGSRFALLSLIAALLVFAAGIFAAIRRGLVVEKATRWLFGALVLIFFLGAALFARPVLLRLHAFNDNSAAFRLWTWRGSGHMALSNPILGTGIGAWTDLYPRYALTGFTRLAHSSYLQMADECGIPALITLLTVLSLIGVTLTRHLAHRPGSDTSRYLPADSRLLLCGLMASLAGGIVQNLIDSDWYVFFLGTTFWTLAGLAAGTNAAVSEKPRKQVATPMLIACGSVAGALTLLTGTQGVGAGFAQAGQAQKANDPGGAAESYAGARAWDPLNGRYPSDQGFQIYYSRIGDLSSAEAAVQSAIALEPNSVNYRRLGTILQAAGRNTEAIAAYKAGLNAEPNSLELLLRLGHLVPMPDALTYYRRLSALELSPVGTARALGESVEPNFAYGDAALGDAESQTDSQDAAAYYCRAALLLEAYVAQGGSLNGQREELNNGLPDPQTDTALQTLYQHVMAAWITIAPADQKALLGLRQKDFAAKFDALLRQAAKPGIL